MTRARKSEARSAATKSPVPREGRLKQLAGSNSGDFNTLIANQTLSSLWSNNADPDQKDRHKRVVRAGLIGIGPRDELEGMMAAQLIAAHNAAMECYRRAMIPEQTFEGRRENLAQANKLSRTYATLLEALNRHRGKGQQTVRVEHVHVHPGGQAIVGNVQHPGGGVAIKSEEQAYGPAEPRALGHTPSAPLWGEEPCGAAVPASGGEGQEPLHHARRGAGKRSPEG